MTIHYNRKSEEATRRNLRSSSTLAEKILWEQLRRKGLNCTKFKRQYSVGKYVIDFYSPINKLAIELDGDIHSEPEVMEHDEIRDEYLKRFRIKILRIKNELVFNNIDSVLELIKSHLK